LTEVQIFKCPNCNGGIAFDSQSQRMKCPYCESEFDIQALLEHDEKTNPDLQDSMQWDAQAGQAWSDGESESLRSYRCNACGGEVVAEETTGATHCPYCDNPVVMTGQFSGTLKPDLVIPFKVDKKAAVAALQNHYKGKVLLPKVFKDENHIQEVKGVYVPVWLFDTDADAHVRFKASRTRHWHDSNYNYTETSYYAVIRGGTLGFANVPVDGSTKMDDTMMESIEPFRIEDAVDFHTAYLSGYLADKYDVNAEESIQRANQRIRSSTESAFAATVTGFDSVIPEKSNIRLSDGKARYALYPVWILNTVWNGQKFTFAINGQTGKIAGDLPMDKAAWLRWLIGVSGVTAAAAYAISYLLWLL
jgi:DNA-directed RNA polymerase subunit RPC12/RpoP